MAQQGRAPGLLTLISLVVLRLRLIWEGRAYRPQQHENTSLAGAIEADNGQFAAHYPARSSPTAYVTA